MNWSEMSWLGAVMSFLAIVLVVGVITFLAIIVARAVKNRRDKGEKTESSDKSKAGIWVFVSIVVLVLIGVWFFNSFRGDTGDEPLVLYWKKLPSTEGKNPKLRSDDYPIVITVDNDKSFEATFYYEHLGKTEEGLLRWDKRLPNGIWRQEAREDYGEFFLKKHCPGKKLSSCRSYLGWHTDKTGKEATTWIVPKG